jgi:molybdopterin/thiamine biosynthesis adenylyltransferase
MSLSKDQVERYARHIMLREVGGPGQQRLLAAHVALVGMGALGGPAALFLAAAGVGRLTLIDDDVVSLSNLQRQVQFASADIGKGKAGIVAARIAAMNPDVSVEIKTTRLAPENARDLIGPAAIILDGSDTFATRFAVNAACHELGATLVSGAVGRWSAQVGVFKSGHTKTLPADDRLPCYRCFVAEAPQGEETCEVVGVVGPLTGMIGARMALEALKEITGAGTSLAGRLWLFDGLGGEDRMVRLKPDPACEVCGV